MASLYDPFQGLLLMQTPDLTDLTHVGRWTVADGYANKCGCESFPFPDLCPRKVAAALAEKDALLKSLSDHLDSGREFYPDGTEHPTTLPERLSMLNQIIAAESQGGDDARKALNDAQDTIAEYRRGILIVLDEGRETQDVGVVMTDLEDLLDSLAYGTEAEELEAPLAEVT